MRYIILFLPLYNLKILDKDRNDLGVPSHDINGDWIPLDDCLDSDLGRYFWEWDGVELKLNY